MTESVMRFARHGLSSLFLAGILAITTGIQDGCPQTDADGDGYSPPEDCDDSNSSIHPGAAETCDGIDNDCDGVIDPNCPTFCWGNEMCNKDQFCSFDSCAAETGQCVTRPTACLDVYMPVCGCDGRTYSNDCYAAASGVSISHSGECEVATQCGGIAGFACDPGYVCIFAPGTCDWADNMGKCVEPPTACTEEYAPVCGCDGKTYSNECFATASGASVDYPGECGTQPVVCADSKECGSTQYCAKKACTDGTGQCTDRPDACPLYFDPVCGCDGITYSNTCDAAASGANVAYAGECQTPPAQCGGLAGLQCPKDQVCIFPIGTCAMMDPMGSCTVPPDICPDLWAPVCGCDGKTYSNDCEATANGMSINYTGECKTTAIQCKDSSVCPKSQYCAYKGCDLTTGVCTAYPGGCIDLYDPVCGCDGRTYSNDCYAAMNGVSVASPDACSSTF